MKGWSVVTGASSGIGAEFARELSRRGYPVLAVARRRERLDALAMEASGMDGRIQPLVADLKTEEGPVADRLRAAGAPSNIMAVWKELVDQEILPEDEDDKFERQNR